MRIPRLACEIGALLMLAHAAFAAEPLPHISYRQIGVDAQTSAMIASPRIYYPKSDRAITAMCRMPGGKQVLIATRDGLLVCDSEGRVLKRHLLSPAAGEVWTDSLRVDGPDAVLDLATADDGTIWVRSAMGLARVNPTGEMPDHAPTDEAAIELYHDAIVRTPVLQRWYAVEDQRVYLPYAGVQAAAYDGREWSTVSSPIPGQVHKLCGIICIAGRRGLYELKSGVRRVEAVEACEAVPLDQSLAVVVADKSLYRELWVLDGMKPTRTGMMLSSTELAVRQIGPQLWVLSVRGEWTVVAVLRDSSGTWKVGRFFAGTGFESFTDDPAGPDPAHPSVQFPLVGGFGTLARLGDPRPQRLLEIPFSCPNIASFGSAYTQVTGCVGFGDHWLVGTATGLGRYNPSTRKFAWLWRVPDRTIALPSPPPR